VESELLDAVRRPHAVRVPVEGSHGTKRMNRLFRPSFPSSLRNFLL
jgi:hypothetical protein